MYKIIELYKKYKEIISYLIMGGLTTLVSIVSYFILSWIYDVQNTLWFTIANLLSWILAVIFAYVTNKKFVFESETTDKKSTAKEFILFVSSRITTFLIELVFMFLTVKVFLMNDKIAKIIAQVIVIVLNYILSKIFVFKKKN